MEKECDFPKENNEITKEPNIPSEKNPQAELKIASVNSDDIELKDHYSIDDISYSKFDKNENEEEENSVKLNKKKKINELSMAILEDNLENFKNLLINNESLLKKKTLDGFTFIQYAALNGSINCFKYLLSLKVKTDEEIEGFHLIHLSLMKCLFNIYIEKSIIMFNYIYQNLPEQKKYVDRLGRTYLHLIFEYNIYEALNNINVEIDDLFIEDNNGYYCLSYICIFGSEHCFWAIAKTPIFLKNIYIMAREKYKSSSSGFPGSSGEYKFLENLFIYKNFNAIATIMLNCSTFIKEIYEDLQAIYNNYSELIKDESINIEKNEITDFLENINKTFQFLQKQTENNNNMAGIPYKKGNGKTAIVYNKNCLNHIKLPDDNPIKHYNKRNKLFENPDRLLCLIDENCGILLNDKIFNHCLYGQPNIMLEINYSFIESKRKSCLNDILKCHDIKYIKALKYKSDNIKNKINKNKKDKNEIHKFWDNVDLDLIDKNYFLYNNNNSDEYENTENTITNKEDLCNYEKIDIDTFINQYSYENIYNTTGCVFDAIDEVMEERAVNAFAIIRPPGHHSGYYGPVENEFETSNGFCIVNNVAIGAAYARYKYSDSIKKIAIVDIDVHHGNGTEEIVEMLNSKNFTKPFKYEKICGVKLMEKQNINWLDFDDAKNVLFISTHIYDKNSPDKFYPYSGSEEKNTKKESDIYPGGIYNIPFELKENHPYEYRNILRSKIIPRLYKFKPDIMFISAGFDGHKLETINQNHMLLQENDYGYIAQQLQFVANKFCEGRMIAVLEGGYNINTGIISPFAQSVFTFIRYMNIGINVLQCHDVKLTSNKRKTLLNEEIELYNTYYKQKVQSRRSERLKQMEEKNNQEEIKNDNIDNKDNKDNKDNNVIVTNDNNVGNNNDINNNFKDNDNNKDNNDNTINNQNNINNNNNV